MVRNKKESIEFLKENVVWSVLDPKPTGGQSTGVTTQTFQLHCPTTGFKCSITHRSEFRGRQMLMDLYELYLMEIVK